MTLGENQQYSIFDLHLTKENTTQTFYCKLNIYFACGLLRVRTPFGHPVAWRLTSGIEPRKLTMVNV